MAIGRIQQRSIFLWSMNIAEANELLKSVRNRFLVRFYDWAKKDFRREMQEGFPLVRSFNNPSCYRFLDLVHELKINEKPLLYSALLRRAHRRAVDILREPADAGEDLMLGRYRAQPTRLVSDISQFQRSAGEKRSLRKILLDKLTPILGTPREPVFDSKEWTHETQLGCWTIRTWIDTGGSHLLEYAHSINAREALPLHDQISILSWLGISRSYWEPGKKADALELSETLIRLYQHFMRAVPGLLDGLSHDIPEPEVRAWEVTVKLTKHRKNGMTVVVLDSDELSIAFGTKANWEIPTSIIPNHLRAVGSRFELIQDPKFTRDAGDPLALAFTYKHLRVEPKRL